MSLTKLLAIPRPWVLLAPMDGVADFAFRQVCYELGAEATIAEFVAAQVVVHRPRETLQAIGAWHGEKPFMVQLFGKRPDELAAAARIIYDHLPTTSIDLNMGCPASKVVASEHGSALMRQPELGAEIVAAVCAATPLPVSVKMRIGFDTVNAPEVAQILEQAGAAMLTVHGRTGKQKFGGELDLRAIAATNAAVTIPVVGNGDIASAADAARMLATTGVDGVMVGRAAVGNPWLFADLLAELKGDRRWREQAPSLGAVALRQARLLVEHKGERALIQLRKHLIAYSRRGADQAVLRALACQVETLADVQAWAALAEVERHDRAA